jgi:hypothetical protein
MVDLGKLLATTKDLHEDTILNMTHLFQRKKPSQAIPRPLSSQMNAKLNGRIDRVLESFLALPAFEAYAAAQNPEYMPLNTISTLQRELEATLWTNSDAQNTAEGLRMTLDALTSEGDQSIEQVALHNLPSESLLQAQLRELA